MIEIQPPTPKMQVNIRYQEYPGGPWHISEMKELTEEEYQAMILEKETKPCPQYQTKV